ncbi:MAG TPA: adenylate/guanylate cyclase domain-containing protein [Xanthobacteraceae bacterium]|nr:adenylate/guanylate cyclase domain-containing protein [Xanthobacteraceae bacterium]
MDPVRRRAALAAFLIALVAGLVAASPALDPLRGLSIDFLTALRWRVFGNPYAASSSPAVVVAIDEETFRTPPFEGTPSVTWTQEIGKVLTAVIDGGAKVVGFDIIFPTSIEQSAVPFGDETLGARVHGFDRDFLRALAMGARAGKVVLGEAQNEDRPLLPSPGQRAAVGFGRNIRSLNIYTDSDEVIRRVPLNFVVDGQPVHSMAAELAARASDTPAAPEKQTDSGLVPDTITLNFAGGSGDIPTYSFADLNACAEKGDKDFFHHYFDGKVVLFGTVLDVEDRKITSKRFATTPETPAAVRCALPVPVGGRTFAREAIAGVYIHATAVDNLLRGDALTEVGRASTAGISFIFAALTAAAALALGPIAAMLAYLGIAAAWTAGATVAFRDALALPLIQPFAAGLAALGAMIGYRFVVADRNKRLLRQSFAYYLAPAVIEKMMASNKPPALVGEMRNVTLYFSDIANFSSFSEGIAPSDLVAAMNQYFSAMTDIIEDCGGFVDKYIGDAIVAVFGAPLDDPNHAANAVRAALRCAAGLGELDRTATAFHGHTLRQRIGLNSGEALVGNIGSRRRFNYTVMGDMVNVASRLEGANKFFGTTVIASEATKALTGAAFVWRELDTIRVKGRSGATGIYEPLAAAGEATPQQLSHSEIYAEGLARWRMRDFAGAAEFFARTASDDPPSALFLERATELARDPPGPNWEPINALEEK